MGENAIMIFRFFLATISCTCPEDAIKRSGLDEKRHDLLDPCPRAALTKIFLDELSMLPMIYLHQLLKFEVIDQMDRS